VQFPPMSHSWQHDNFGFWVMGLPAVGVVGLPPYPKHQYDRKYSIIQLWVLGQPRWRRSKCRTISSETLNEESYCLRDISPSRTHNRRDRSPGYRLCYVTEQYGPRIGYLK
jgi:hypothetical protein